MNFKKSCYLLLLSLLAFGLAVQYLQLSVWIMVLPVLLWLVLLGIASFRIQWNFFLPAIHRGNQTNSAIALSFDDGPHPVFTPQVLALLKQYDAVASFFCIGKAAAKHPELLRQIRAAGHLIGNHSYSHAQFIDAGNKKRWLDEIHQADRMLESATGEKPVFFRPPYGITTPHLAAALRETSHLVAGWQVRPYDTLQSRSPESILNTILSRVRPGDIILLHDTHDRVVPVLERLLPVLREKNFTFVTIAELT